MADFERRGFRTTPASARAVLEAHAASFIAGFNAAGPAEADDLIAGLHPDERGFAYEGAGMRAGLGHRVTPRPHRRVERLLAGPGRRYPHLIHVGYGWASVTPWFRLPVGLPRTPLLRWLALDGAGFAEVFLGNRRVLERRCTPRRTAALAPRLASRLAGCGRALWFVHCADPDALIRQIAHLPAAAAPELWAGVGLAATYAGGVLDRQLETLADASGEHRPAFGQGVVFGVTAHLAAEHLPPHTEVACRTVLGVDPSEAARWSDTAAAGLTARTDLAAYQEWRARLRGRIAASTGQDAA